ncbi:zinc-binding dehydrogenase [Cellulosimicrobium sp. CUA-896]|uniref:zinc-binding dehydrogenase n=1 Tax=Cellulosimicrobium sp. CUA-896 TaxID=1517881 RepID=UPI002101B132|nr:zinc-binding dehydrogenase [Cellulosimicrobium sp. CUA-896]
MVGASGCVGTAAVQIAVHAGARVTAVCGPRGVDLVRDLGAAEVVDRTAEDVTARRDRYDVVLDVAGASSYRRCRHLLTDDGVYLVTVPSPAILWRTLWTSRRTRGRRGVVAFTGLRSEAQKSEDLRTALRLGVEGALRPVVDTAYPLEEIAAAHRHVEHGHKAGTVVVTFA